MHVLDVVSVANLRCLASFILNSALVTGSLASICSYASSPLYCVRMVDRYNKLLPAYPHITSYIAWPDPAKLHVASAVSTHAALEGGAVTRSAYDPTSRLLTSHAVAEASYYKLIGEG